MTNFIIVEDAPSKLPATQAAPPEPRATRRTREMGAAVTALASARPLAQASKASDRRWALRKRTEMPGFIAHSKNPQGVRCIVRDTSSSGALVEVMAGSDRFSNPADEVPERFTLVFISYKERTEVACAVMRRTGRMLGVRYVGSFRTFPAPHSTPKPATPVKKR